MKYLGILTILPFLGCAGLNVPFTKIELMEWEIEFNRDQVNTKCISIETLHEAAQSLETQYLTYMKTLNPTDSINIDNFKTALGDKCTPLLIKLSTPQIKTELYGDIEIIKDADILQYLGGFSFDFVDISTIGGMEPTFHIKQKSKGPKHRLVAIYSLQTGAVVHFNYSGTNDVDLKSRVWVLDEVIKQIIDTGSKVVVP